MMLASLLLTLLGPADPEPVFTVTGGPTDATHVVVRVPAPPGATGGVQLLLPDGQRIPGQISPAGLTAASPEPELTFTLPAVKANETLSVKMPRATTRIAYPQFRFQDQPGEHSDTLFGDKSLVRFVHKRRVGTTPDEHELTFKPFHHVFDPETGEGLVTAGAGLASDKSLLYPHHRGLYFGWMRATYGSTVADTWHGKNNVYTEVEAITARVTGPVFGRQQAHLNWIGPDGLQFAEEERELTTYAAPGGTLIDFTAVVSTKLPKVTLDGDPQHAGFHFRAAQDVVQTKAETVFTRPDGADEPGRTRNWTPKDSAHKNLPWNAMSFTSNGQRYTAVYLDHPENPKEARFSEREYGRFGSYFVATVTPKTPVTVRYRVFVKRGNVTVAECDALAAGFAGGITTK